MQTIDLSGLHAQFSSPKRDARSPVLARVPPKTHTFNVANPGAAPNVVLFRRFRGAAGSSINLAPAAGEIGTLLRSGAGAANPLLFDIDTDGFTAISAQQKRLGVGTFYIITPPSREFRMAYLEKCPNDACFPDTTMRETVPTTSALKSCWYMNSINGGAVLGRADLYLANHNGPQIIFGGNQSQPFISVGSAICNMVDGWDWNGWNSIGYYQKANEIDPIGGNGITERKISSGRTGVTKTTKTKIINNTLPVYGTSGRVDLATSEYDYFHVWTYFEEDSGDYITNLYKRNVYLACGAGSYQCLYLADGPVFADAFTTEHLATSWVDGASGQVLVTTDEWEAGWATHAFLRCADGRLEVMALT
jgi:hypothetical protein